MSLRMKTVSVAMVFFLVVASVLAAAPPPVHAADYGVPSNGEMFVILAVFVGGMLWIRNAISNSVEDSLETWFGHSFDEVVLVWGPPSYVGELPSGAYIVGYTQTSTYYSPGQSRTNVQAYPLLNSATATTTTSPGVVTSQHNYRMFYLNPDGIVTGVSWQGINMQTPKAP